MQALATCAALVLSADTAMAASCASLTAELRQLESSSGSRSPEAQKWVTAKQQQQKALTAAERDAGFFGCATSAAPKCSGLNGKIERMKANLAAIERQLAKSGGGSAANANRLRKVRASLQSMNCNAPARQASADDSTGEQPKSLLSRLFGSRSQQDVELASAKTGDREIAAVRSQTRNGDPLVHLPTGRTFRTLCVRTCDGYFFPLSFKAGHDQLAYDEARCSEICPASETELYVYRNPGEDQSKMTSLAGAPYADQPFAFRFRKEYVQGCSCRDVRQSQMHSSWKELTDGSSDRIFFSDISAGLPQRSLQPSRGDTYADGPSAPSPLARIPLRQAQLPAGEDPDTRFNMQMGFDVSVPLSETVKRLKGQHPAEDNGPTAEGDLPLLSLRVRQGTETENADVVAASPVFKKHENGFSPAPDPKASVRVVGPEYFVAQ